MRSESDASGGWHAADADRGGGSGSPPPAPNRSPEATPGSRSGWPTSPPRPGASPRQLTPPSAWGPASVGPGSPAGSVRPPDTSGTVDAPDKPRRRGRFATFVLVLLGAIAGTVLTLLYADDVAPGLLPQAVPTGSAGPAVQPIEIDNLEGESAVSVVAAAVTPSVVRIDITDGSESQPLGVGSGVIYNDDGYIITNNHVVEQAGTLKVKLANGQEYDAEVIGTDPTSDLAVIKVDETGLPPIPRREDAPVVGETAIAIGSPFGLDATVTTGVVSAVGRDIRVPDPQTGSVDVVPAVVQTDAAINPGNSGGALVDNEGRLLGINTAIFTESGGSQGVGFAIPADQAFTIADQLIETGEVRRALLGVSGLDVTPQVAERMALPDESGALVTEVSEDSGADEAGLRVDDVIVRVDDTEIENVTDLVVAIQSRQPDEEVEVVYFRNGERETASVVLGERPR